MKLRAGKKARAAGAQGTRRRASAASAPAVARGGDLPPRRADRRRSREYARAQARACVAKHSKRPCEVHLILTVDKYRQHGEVTVKSGRLAVTAQEEDQGPLFGDRPARGQGRTPAEEARGEKRQASKVRSLSTGEVLSAVEQRPRVGPQRSLIAEAGPRKRRAGLRTRLTVTGGNWNNSEMKITEILSPEMVVPELQGQRQARGVARTGRVHVRASTRRSRSTI